MSLYDKGGEAGKGGAAFAVPLINLFCMVE